MTGLADILNAIIIYPLYALLEASFMLCYNVFKESYIAIAGLSIAVSLLTLPLYIVAERWSAIERNVQKSLEGAIKRIKTTFHGDEQYMMLTTLYREHRYHPLMALRSSIGLLIQIPFFIAAYTFLSNLALLQGEELRLLHIKDLAAPDAMLCLFGFDINVLPIAMTAINIIAGAVYTKGLKIKDKVPIYAMALLFLAILYTSPSGLVLYWTMNNVFSLVKNIFYKIKHPGRAAYIILCATVVYVVQFTLLHHSGFLYRRLLLCFAFSLTLAAPLAIKAYLAAFNGALKPLAKNKRARTSLFFLSALCLAVLCGAVGPSSVIGSSVTEFCGIDGVSPMYFVRSSILQSIGLFVFWPVCVYFLFGERIQTLLSVLFACLLLSALVNTYAFQSSAGNLSRLMTFDGPVLMPSLQTALVNTAILASVIACAVLLIKHNKIKVLNTLFIITALSLALAFAVQDAKIEKAYISYKKDGGGAQSKDIKSVYHLSKTGRNIVVIMMDRAESAYLPVIFKKFKELKDTFSGFTFYPNTASYNQGTLLGAPPLYGGYSYTPLEMNKRKDERLVDKHNEALLLMPRILTEQSDFTAAVSDLSWAGYKWIPDMSITDPYPKIKGFNTERRYSDMWVKEHPKNIRAGMTREAIKRNMIYFSIFKAVPTYLRDTVYDDGAWWSSDDLTMDVMEFIDYYSVLYYLPRLTDFEGEGDTFIMFANNTTHSGQELAEPDYEPSTEVVDEDEADKYYPSEWGNIAMYQLVGKWLDLLKDEGVYDNTRIIIAADHGIGKDEALEIAPYVGWERKKDYAPDHNNPLLLVKDFGAKGSLKTDYRFMTNADVPQIVFDGIVQNPINPWSGKAFSFPAQSEKKAEGVVLTHMWNPGSNIYTFKVPKDDWVTIKDNIFDKRNWTKYSVESIITDTADDKEENLKRHK